MALKIYNVLTRNKEEFVPLEQGKVKMYACGITVSDNAHIGHAYQAIVFDVIKKYLNYIGYDVKYVRNYTDVDDKIIAKAKEKNIDPMLLAETLIAKTDKEIKLLNVETPTVQARATKCIDDIINMISRLIEKGYAYSTELGNVYFEVSKFNNYGRFSNRLGDEEISGTRKEIEKDKKDDKDFALWKSSKQDEIYWESPWGKGRPGWHIECSTMSMKYLGEQIDIHGGGKDLLFPHHENEIAQSEALTNKQFAKYWIHNGLVKVNSQKMSKSLGNSILIEDLLKKYDSDSIRLAILQNNYRSDLNITKNLFNINQNKIYSIYKLFNIIDEKNINTNKIIINIEDEFKEAMDNDFNTALAIANLFNYISEIGKRINSNNYEEAASIKNEIVRIYNVLGILNKNPKDALDEIKNKFIINNNISVNYIEEQIKQRKGYKESKEYEKADKIRDELLSKGIVIEDKKEGTTWDIDFTILD
ncbi:MAG TPA: cysteine--tRNA ligase [Bacilli bacterium]|nr:cysteine--tRNA ligase [Bacilli bacterium]